MITLLTGENSFELSRAIDALVTDFGGHADRVDGSDIEPASLPDLLSGTTLFADKRLVIIRQLSVNKQIWDTLPEWLERTSDDVHIVLVEPKPDKRTKTYKELKKRAVVREFPAWSDKEVFTAEKWTADEAARQGLQLDKKSIQLIVARVGVDQWQLFHALEKLSVLDNPDSNAIERYVELTPTENVFNLFDAALRGDTKKVMEMIEKLRLLQDPYMTMGLLASQAFQLATLSVATKPTNEVASDIGAHPYALSKLAPHAKRLGRKESSRVVTYLATTDAEMKSSPVDRWTLVESALLKIAQS